MSSDRAYGSSRARAWLPWALMAGGGVLAFVGFAGFGIWPVAFVAFVPMLAALELEHGARVRRIVALSWLAGFVATAGGYYWIVEMLDKFSGFPSIVNVLVASVLFIYIGGQFALFGWLCHRAMRRGWNVTLSAVAAWAAVELLFPNLFPFYYGASFHSVPLLVQTAELGGPILLGALCLTINGAIYEIARAVVQNSRLPRVVPAVAATALGATLIYSGIRIEQVETRAAKMPKLDVGIIQVNMGILAKRRDPREGHLRHVRQTLALERKHDPDLVVWPESAYTFFLPGSVDNVQRSVMGPLETPLLFGGLSLRGQDGKKTHYNTAYLAEADGDLTSTYDKTYLLAFGEYIPFGERFPFLYELSPNTGRFTPGDHVRPLELHDWRITTLICYEDILPGFVRQAVRKGDPHLLVNITNDAWFGDTHEPWIHLALAKLRAVEHRRYLVRATNSGVSAVVDPVGRLKTHSGVFTRETLTSEVAMMHGWTPYLTVGDWPGWLGLVSIVWMAFVRRPRQRRASSGGSHSS